MKVWELIRILEKYDLEMPIFVFLNDEIYPIDFVDNTISDRIDLNLKESI